MVKYQPFPLLRQAHVSICELMYIKSLSFSEISYRRKTLETVTEVITASCNFFSLCQRKVLERKHGIASIFQKVNTTQTLIAHTMRIHKLF